MVGEQDANAMRSRRCRGVKVSSTGRRLTSRFGMEAFLDDDPPRVDVALVGPDVRGGLIVEFLPMSGLDSDVR